jgi:hypothetical protein
VLCARLQGPFKHFVVINKENTMTLGKIKLASTVAACLALGAVSAQAAPVQIFSDDFGGS